MSETGLKWIKKGKTGARSEPFLYPFRWFIGFLPSHRKAAIEKKYGLPARNATSGSITVEFVLCVLFGHLWWGSILFDPLVVPVCLNTFILLIDIVFRYGSYFREDASPYGFLEWFLVFLTGSSGTNLPRAEAQKMWILHSPADKVACAAAIW